MIAYFIMEKIVLQGNKTEHFSLSEVSLKLQKQTTPYGLYIYEEILNVFKQLKMLLRVLSYDTRKILWVWKGPVMWLLQCEQ